MSKGLHRLINWLPCVLACLACPAAIAENAPDPTGADSVLPSPIPRARWSEDWSILGSEEHLYEQLAFPFKRVPLNEDGSSFMSFGGEFRLNYESYDPADRGLTDTGHSDAFMSRLVAHVDWHPDRRWRAFGQLGYTDASDREGGAKPGDRSNLNLWQAFVDGRFHLSDRSRVDVRLGRQIYEKAGYFVGAAEARGVRQFYDGFRGAWLDDRFAKLDVFAAEFVDTGDGSFDMGGTGEYLWGTSAGFRFPARDVNLSFSYFGWDLEDRQFQQDGEAFNDERRHTLLAWINRPVADSSHWAFDYYFAYQFGRFDDQQASDISAFAFFGEWKYSMFKKVETPIFGLKTSYFSGDSDPTDRKLETFYNPVFVTVYFSYARDVMPQNLVHLQPNLAYRFSDRLKATVSTDFLWRASTSDAFYSSPSSIGAPADASSARFIGSQAQFAINWQPTKSIVASMHLVQFWAGQFIEESGGENQTYFRIELNYLL